MQKILVIFSCLIVFSTFSSPAFSQSADDFNYKDLEKLPDFYEKQVQYAKNILNIQDISLSLSSVSDVDIFYDYCIERMDSNWEGRKKFRDYADTQSETVENHKKMIDANEEIMVHKILDKLYENSGLEHTSKAEMISAVYAPLERSRKRSKEVMRRMLIHDMVWHISDCKKALKALDEGNVPANQFVTNSLKSYLALLADADGKTQAIADKLLQPLPAEPQE